MRGWIEGADGTSYPPEPWRLGGWMLVSAFRVRLAELPDDLLAPAPHTFRPCALGGSALVAVAFARYTPSGVLAYSELLVAVAGRRVNECTIGRIWVDSAASRTGARELWGIPKELGDFSGTDGAAPARRGASAALAMGIDGRRVAGLSARTGGALLPGLRRLPLRTAQRQGERAVTCSNLLLARPRRLAADWRFEPSGPLGFMAARTPLVSVALTDMTVVFGAGVVRS